MKRYLLVLALAACGDNLAPTNTVDATVRQTVTDSVTLQPGMLIEGSWTAGSSDLIGLDGNTTVAGMDWDIHGHADGGTQEIIAAFAQKTITYEFQPTQQAQWFLLLRNSSPAPLTITIHMDLFGAAEWNGWQ